MPNTDDSRNNPSHKGTPKPTSTQHNDYDAFDLMEIDWSKRLQELPKIVKKFYNEKLALEKHEENDAKAQRQRSEQFRKEHGITVTCDTQGDQNSENEKFVVPSVVHDFEHVLVREAFPALVRTGLKRANFKAPTAIQSQAWPIIMQGHDMVGIAETGSGKSLALLLPAITHLLGQASQQTSDAKERKKGPLVLVLAPTRELVQQLQGEVDKILGTNESGHDNSNHAKGNAEERIRCVCVYGGENRKQQIRQLRRGAHIMIATPGRLLDYIQAGVVKLKHVSMYILDEGDRMLDMGFAEQVEQINSQIRPDRQTVMFSATWNKNVQKLTVNMMSKMRFMVNIGSMELSANDNVKQEFLFIQERDKIPRLLKLLDELVDGSRLLVFAQTRKTVDQITSKLRSDGWPALSLHGERTQKEREWVIQEFRRGDAPILVATDVAARGLDIPDVKCVINFDLPTELENYVHRIGRTGRAGKHGHAIAFFTPVNARITASMIKLLRESKQPIPAQMQKLHDLLHSGNQERKKEKKEKEEEKEVRKCEKSGEEEVRKEEGGGEEEADGDGDADESDKNDSDNDKEIVDSSDDKARPTVMKDNKNNKKRKKAMERKNRAKKRKFSNGTKAMKENQK